MPIVPFVARLIGDCAIFLGFYDVFIFISYLCSRLKKADYAVQNTAVTLRSADTSSHRELQTTRRTGPHRPDKYESGGTFLRGSGFQSENKGQNSLPIPTEAADA